MLLVSKNCEDDLDRKRARVRGAGRKEEERDGQESDVGAAGGPSLQAGESEQERQILLVRRRKGLEISLGVERASNGTAPRETDGEADAS